MAQVQGRKYASLPDLDSAPDVYETAEPSTDAPPPEPPVSPVHSEKDFDDGKRSGVDRGQIQLGNARNQFRPAQVDARNVDFSDQISDAPKSYRVYSSHRNSRRALVVDEHGDLEDDEDESFDSRVSRLQREVEEVRSEAERRQASAKQGANGQLTTKDDPMRIAQLSSVLHQVRLHSQMNALEPWPWPGAALTNSDGILTGDSTIKEAANGKTGGRATAKLTDSSTIDVERVLAKAVDFEARLAAMESALGIGMAPLQQRNENIAGKNVIASLDLLDKRIAALASTTGPSLESMTQEIRQLTREASQLEEARKNARVAKDVLMANASRPALSARMMALMGTPPPSSPGPPAAVVEDEEQTRQIDNLINSLPSIEAALPLLPVVIDRLSTLRVLHADAAMAQENVTALEHRQAQMANDLVKWKEGLDEVEKAMAQAEQTMTGNSEAVQNWIQDLQSRFQNLSQ